MRKFTMRRHVKKNAETSKNDPARLNRTLSPKCLQNAVSSLDKGGSLFHTVEVASDRSGSKMPLTALGIGHSASLEFSRREAGLPSGLFNRVYFRKIRYAVSRGSNPHQGIPSGRSPTRLARPCHARRMCVCCWHAIAGSQSFASF